MEQRERVGGALRCWRRISAARSLVLVTVACALVVACSRPAEAPEQEAVADTVKVSLPACDAPPGLRASCPDVSRVRTWVVGLLEGAGLEVVSEGDAALRATAVLRIFWPPGVAEADAPHALWWLEVDVTPTHPRSGIRAFSRRAQGAFPAAEREPENVVSSVEAALERLAFQLREEVSLQRGGPDEVRRLWFEGTPEGRLAAVREAARLPFPEIAPELLVELEDADPELFLAVAGALATLGADAQAPGLIAALDLENPELLVSVLPALARLHHPDVPAFLEVLATGHPSPMVRHAALQALPAASGR